jgi:hypothetical protein
LSSFVVAIHWDVGSACDRLTLGKFREKTASFKATS